jgi:hypothetical protein
MDKNYQSWKFKVELFLMKADLRDVIWQESLESIIVEWSAKDWKARATTGLLLEDNELHLV